MSSVIAGLVLLIATELCSALPQGDGLATGTITTGEVGTSEFSWVSSWASETSGANSAHQSQHSSPASTSATSQSSSGSSSSATRIIIPVVVVCGVALAALGILVLFKTRKQRALRAHRRKTSWMASNKYKWQPNQTKPEGAIDETEEQAPPWPSAPTVRAPHRASTHERKTSIL